jgi:hypothetical protein
MFIHIYIYIYIYILEKTDCDCVDSFARGGQDLRGFLSSKTIKFKNPITTSEKISHNA